MPILNCSSSLPDKSTSIELSPEEFQPKRKIPASGIFHTTEDRLRKVLNEEYDRILEDLSNNLEAINSNSMLSEVAQEFYTEYEEENKSTFPSPQPQPDPKQVYEIWKPTFERSVQYMARFKDLLKQSKLSLIQTILQEEFHELRTNQEK